MENITPEQINDNTFKLIGSDWMLITAGTPESFNTMTASWGGFGVLWQKKICFCVVRPNRHTFGFINKEMHFTLSFFKETEKPILHYCGSHSGKDVDKAKTLGLSPRESPAGSVYFSEARLVIECRKIYTHDIDPNYFIDPSIDANYPKKDYHRMFIGEITTCMTGK